LARQGDAANCIFFVEEGSVQIYHTMDKEVVDSDDDEEDEVPPALPLGLSR